MSPSSCCYWELPASRINKDHTHPAPALCRHSVSTWELPWYWSPVTVLLICILGVTESHDGSLDGASSRHHPACPIPLSSPHKDFRQSPERMLTWLSHSQCLASSNSLKDENSQRSSLLWNSKIIFIDQFTESVITTTSMNQFVGIYKSRLKINICLCWIGI